MGGWTSLRNVLAACDDAARKHGLKDVKSLLPPRRIPPSSVKAPTPAKPLTDAFVTKVAALLPPQPWKPGIHRKISDQLNCETSAYFAAVERLIEEGHVLRQRDGVLYDAEGNVVSFDPDRVDPETLELLIASG
jgi:hypothetical protein